MGNLWVVQIFTTSFCDWVWYVRTVGSRHYGCALYSPLGKYEARQTLTWKRWAIPKENGNFRTVTARECPVQSLEGALPLSVFIIPPSRRDRLFWSLEKAPLKNVVQFVSLQSLLYLGFPGNEAWHISKRLSRPAILMHVPRSNFSPISPGSPWEPTMTRRRVSLILCSYQDGTASARLIFGHSNYVEAYLSLAVDLFVLSILRHSRFFYLFFPSVL